MAEKRSRSLASNVKEPSPHFPHRPDRNIALTGIYPPIPLAEQKAAQEGKQLVSEGLGKTMCAKSYVQSCKYHGCENMQGGRWAGKRHELLREGPRDFIKITLTPLLQCSAGAFTPLLFATGNNSGKPGSNSASAGDFLRLQS